MSSGSLTDFEATYARALARATAPKSVIFANERHAPEGTNISRKA